MVREALGLGRQYVAAAPAAQFGIGFGVAVPDGACSWPGTEGCSKAIDLAARRAAFLAELRDLVRRLDRIEDLAIRRYIRDAVNAMPPTEGPAGGFGVTRFRGNQRKRMLSSGSGT